MAYLSNRPQVSMRYRLNTRRIRKPLACGSWSTNSSRVLPTSPVVYQLISHKTCGLLLKLMIVFTLLISQETFGFYFDIRHPFEAVKREMKWSPTPSDTR